MNSQATLLYRLQKLDLGIAQRQQRLTEIAAVLGQNVQVQQAQKTLSAATAGLAPWQAKVLNLDLEIKSLAQKAAETERSLYSGKISNPKTLGDMEKEIVSLKKHRGTLEDELLEAMVEVEGGQAAVADAQKALDSAQALFAGSQVDLLDEQKRLQSELVEMKANRHSAAALCDPAILARYEALRPKKRGQAVSLMRGDSCMTCGVEQTSMIAQLVRQGSQIVLCESCGRILAAEG